MKNILFIVALIFIFGSQGMAQDRKNVSKIEKILVKEMTKKETERNPKYIKTKPGKKSNKLIAVKGASNGKVIKRPIKPVRPPKPPTPPCICHPADIIADGLSLAQLLEIYPSALVVLSGQDGKLKKEFKLSSSNSTISIKEFKSFEGDIDVSFQFFNKNNKDNPAPVQMTLQR